VSLRRARRGHFELWYYLGMAFTLRWHASKRVLYFALSGCLSEDSLKDPTRAVYDAISRLNPLVVITDMAGVTDFQLTGDQLRGLAASGRSWAHRSVFVAQRPVVFGCIRMVAGHRPSEEYQIVPTLADACELLGVQFAEFLPVQPEQKAEGAV
jgi:hypothetical protein